MPLKVKFKWNLVSLNPVADNNEKEDVEIIQISILQILCNFFKLFFVLIDLDFNDLISGSQTSLIWNSNKKVCLFYKFSAVKWPSFFGKYCKKCLLKLVMYHLDSNLVKHSFEFRNIVSSCLLLIVKIVDDERTTLFGSV